MRQLFRPRQRIRRRSEFQRVYDQGRRAHGRFMTLVILPNASSVSRLGVSATRKFGNAVQRNAAKRRLREIFRHDATSLSADIVVIPRPTFLEASFDDLAAEYHTLIQRQAEGPLRRRSPRKS
jgi:ribonuclease P protein component